MRPGPSNAQMATALSVGAEVSILRGDRVLATRVPVDELKLEWSDSRVVPGQLTYKAPLGMLPQGPEDPLNFYGQRSQVSVIYRSSAGEEYSVPLGQYLHTSWKEESGAVAVTALDLLQILEEDPFAWPSSPEEGASILSEMQRLAGRSMTAVLDDGVVNRAVPRTTQWGYSRTEALTDLARAYNFGVRVGWDARLHAYPLRQASQVDVIFSRENGLLVSATRTRPDTRLPNRWIAVATIDEQRITRTGENTAWPTNPDVYGFKTSRIEVSSAKSTGDVAVALDQAMRADRAALTAATLEVVPDARIEVGDIVSAIDHDQVLTGRVRAYVLPVTNVGDTMRLDIDILNV